MTSLLQAVVERTTVPTHTDEAATEQFATEGHGRRRAIDEESAADGLRPRIEPEGEDDEASTLSLRRMARR
jgi:hypothetical protein